MCRYIHKAFRIENMSTEFQEIHVPGYDLQSTLLAKAVNGVWQRIACIETCQWLLYSASFPGFHQPTSTESISISRPVSRELYCVTESTKVVDVLIANFCQFDRFSPPKKREKKKGEKKKKRKEKIQLGYFFFSSTFEIFLSNMICNLKKFNFETRKVYVYIMYNVKFTNRIYNC